jgi:hypothetical protein
MRYLLAALAVTIGLGVMLGFPAPSITIPSSAQPAFERMGYFPAAVTRVAHAPKSTYAPNDWVLLGVAANLDGVLTVCDQTGLYKNKTHERITRRMMLVAPALERSQHNQLGWQMVNNLLAIGQTEGRVVVLPDPSDGGVKIDPDKRIPITSKEACKDAEVEARKLMTADAILDLEGVDDGDGA